MNKILPVSSKVTYDDRGFIINGSHKFIYSGELHYFRIPPSQWYDRLLKAKRAFLNSIGSYIAWNWHEQYEGKFKFEGDRDLEKWSDSIGKLELLMIARVGPYICSEWDFGGFPAWLHTKNCILRRLNPNYLRYCKHWFAEVNKRIRKHLVSNGGNIYLYQIENELEGEDTPYLLKLMEFAQKSGIDGVPFVTNQNAGIRGTKIIDSLDISPAPWETIEIEENIGRLLNEQPGKPGMIMELEGGWFTEFGGHLPTLMGCFPSEWTEILFKTVLGAGINFINIYMYHGGTNPVYWSGKAKTTSYDFDAPIREWGELSKRYFVTRRIGGFIDALGDQLLKTKPAKDYCRVNDDEVTILVRKGEDSLFIFPLNLTAKDKELKLLFKDQAHDRWMELPKNGNYCLYGHTMSILPINLKINDNISIIYSTSQIFNVIHNRKETIVIVYEKSGFEGEMVFEFKDGVDIVGDLKYEWLAKGKLCCNFTHSLKTRFVSFCLKGGERLRLCIITTEKAEQTWIVTYDEAKYPLISNVYFLRDWVKDNDSFTLEMEIKPNLNSELEFLLPRNPKNIIADGNPINHKYYGEHQVISFKLPAHTVPSIYYELNSGWKCYYESLEIEPSYDDSEWMNFKPWKCAEEHGIIENGYILYRTTFDSPGDVKDLHLILSSFHDESSVFINGRFCGHAVNQFYENITDYLVKPGGKNILLVRVEAVGRPNSRELNIPNGIVGPVYLSSQRQQINLTCWKQKWADLFEEEKFRRPLPEVSSNYDDSCWEEVVVDEKWDNRFNLPSVKGPGIDGSPRAKRRYMWYRTGVMVPEQYQGKAILLEFGEIKDVAWVYVNGNFVGRHDSLWHMQGKYNSGSFAVDVTKHISFGKINIIAICVLKNRVGKGGLHKYARLSFFDKSLNFGWKIKGGLHGQEKGWYTDTFNDTDWSNIDLEDTLDSSGRIVWYRRWVEVKLPEGYIAPLRITIDKTNCNALIYFNGKLIGRYSKDGPQNHFYIPEDLIRDKNLIALAVDTHGRESQLGKISISPYLVTKKIKIETYF